jgi:uncharacterized protein YutD
MIFKIVDTDYEVIKDENKAFDLEEFTNLYTDYFTPYDYILGDYSYGKLRLKGFFDPNNKKVNKINNYKDIDNYINKYCSFNCNYFILKKAKK